MLAFYKRLGHLIHMSLVASLKSEEEEVKFIKELLNEYPEIKAKISRYVARIADGWAKSEENKNHSEYLS